MENPRPENVAVVDEIRQRFQDADGAILTEYRGLKVKDLAGLRRSLRPSGGEYKIYKNTMVRLAARASGLDDLEPLLTGPTAIAFVDGDAAAVAKALRDYARTNPLLVLKGGVLGATILTAQETAALAELPSREVLLARFAGLLAAPMQQLAGLLQALPRNFAYGLAALRDQKAEGAPEQTEGAPEQSAPSAAARPEAAESGSPESESPESGSSESESSGASAGADTQAETESAPSDGAAPEEPTPTE